MNWYDQIPKVELHVHLEGAIPLPTLWQLIQKYGGKAKPASLAALRERFIYRDFAHFIAAWVWKNSYLREYEDFTLIAEAFARAQQHQNICYSEVFYSPPDFFRHGLKTQPLTAAIRKGLERVPGVEVALVIDLVRDFGPELATRTLSEVNEVRHYGVIGIGIGGSEQDFPPADFAAVFEQARKLDFRTSAHAGEAAGPESIRSAIEVLRVDRIGHGTRAFEDPGLVELLAERQIPLEVCPTSNICSGVVSEYLQHPVKDYYSRGLAVTINSDDPVMFDITLAEEYRKLNRILNFSRNDMRRLILQAIDSSWLGDDRKKQYLVEFTSDRNWQ